VDLTRSVTYRGLNLNSYVTKAGDGKRWGILLEDARFGSAPGVGYREKRAQDDGYDASDVTLGMRSISLHGYIYGYDRGDLFDRLQDLRSALTPSSSYHESPGLQGYLPLQFYMPTNHVTDFPAGYKQLMMLARPVNQPEHVVKRDAGAFGIDTEGAAIEWNAPLEAKDPRFYVWPQSEVLFSATKTGNLVNRGDYPAPLKFIFTVPGSAPGGSVLVEVGGSRMRITVPNSTVNQTFRYDGTLKVLTVEENDVETLRMDLLSFLNNSTYPTVPSGKSEYRVTLTGVTLSQSAGANMLFFSEAFA
jgi:hypothetical protein